MSANEPPPGVSLGEAIMVQALVRTIKHLVEAAVRAGLDPAVAATALAGAAAGQAKRAGVDLAELSELMMEASRGE
jgi:hypothetical protein